MGYGAGCKGGECLVLGDSIIRNVGNECSDMKVECFLGVGIFFK